MQLVDDILAGFLSSRQLADIGLHAMLREL